MNLNLLFLINLFVLQLNCSEYEPMRRYHLEYCDVYDGLVQSVLEGNLAVFQYELSLPGANPYQRLSYWRTLRHVAFNPKIDACLKALGVAVPKSVPKFELPEMFVGIEDKEIIDLIGDIRDEMDPKYFVARRCLARRMSYSEMHPDFRDAFGKLVRDFNQRTVFELEAEFEDIYGKNPDEYGLEAREKIAAEMRKSKYVKTIQPRSQLIASERPKDILYDRR